MSEVVFAVGDVVEPIPDRDRMNVVAPRVTRGAVVASVIPHDHVRDGWHPQLLTLKTPAGEDIVSADTYRPARFSGWYFRKIS